MENNVLILPKISDQTELAKYYSLADVFVICSKRENLPTTCLEAQCCGTPVVGFDAGGTKETSVLSKGDFVEYGDIYALKDKVNNAFKYDPVEVFERAKSAFSKDKMSKTYMDEYDKNGRKERILLIDVNCKYSSTGKIVYDLYKSIVADGREAAICYGRGPIVEGRNIYKFGLDFETIIHATLARVTGYNGFFSPLSTIRLIKFIDDFNPDIIHIHELHAYFVNIKPLINYIKSKGISLIWTFHCEYMYTGKCGHAYECMNFTKECGNCPLVKEYPKSIFFDKTKKMLKIKRDILQDYDFTIITPSEWLANRVKLSFLKDKNIKVIYNGIDTSVFKPVGTESLRSELKIPKNDKVVVAVAPDIMSAQKGGEWVVDLSKLMNNENVFFILVGAK